MTSRVAILGGTGYGGMECLRLLLGHPMIQVTALTSRSDGGMVSARHAHLRGLTDLSFTRESTESIERLARDNDVLISARPHGVASRDLPPLLDKLPSLRVLDLSGDFRLRDPAAYPEWYGFEHPAPGWLAKAVAGLPEVDGADLRTARLVANPGCHALAAILALWPLVRAGLLAGPPAVVSLTGSSGSGAEPKVTTHHPERFLDLKAYRPLHHQHVPEIAQALQGLSRVDFVPISAPVARGIHLTAFAPIGAGSAPRVQEAYEGTYAGKAFVRLLPAQPSLRAVVGSNFVDLTVVVEPQVVVITLVMDNLVKGMAGTAVQNLNRCLGLEETLGLRQPGLGL